MFTGGTACIILRTYDWFTPSLFIRLRSILKNREERKGERKIKRKITTGIRSEAKKEINEAERGQLRKRCPSCVRHMQALCLGKSRSNNNLLAGEIVGQV
jgi:hypothetical protein